VSNPLVKSAAVATAKTACCAVIGIAGGHFGMLALGALGIAGAIKPAEKILEFAIEKSSEIFAEIGIDWLGDREGNGPLEQVFREALRKALNEIRAKAGETRSFLDSIEKEKKEEIEDWFDNWDRALKAPVLKDFEQIPLKPDTTEGAEQRLREFLRVLYGQGKIHGRKANASVGTVVLQPGALEMPPEELVDLLKKELPIVLPPIFDELLTSERNNQANKLYVNRFIDKFKEEYGPAIKAIKETVDSIKQDTTLIPGIDSKLDILVARGPAVDPRPTRKPQNLPFASLGPLFKGREQDLERLEGHSAAAIVQPASITGLGGIGKTRLAIEYALRNEERFSALLFVNASSPQELESNLALLSSPLVLNLPEYAANIQALQYAAVIRWLQTEKEWVLILDNADTKDAVKAVQRLVPELHNGQVLITSRIDAWPSSVHSIGLHLLGEKAAVAYLLERTIGHRQPQGGDEAQAALLSQDLGWLALALEQAAAYINARAISFAKYRALWQASSVSLIDYHDELTMEYPRSVAVTLQTTIDELSPEGRELLNILAWLAPDPIPISLLSVEGGPLAAESAEGLAEEKWPAAAEQAETALGELVLFSLASRTEDKEGFSIHRLVQAVARRSQPGDEQHKWVEAALRWVNAGFPSNSNDVRFWPVAEALAPHARGIAGEADRRGISGLASRLMNELGLFLKSRAEWSEAEPLYRRALQIDEKSFGNEHPRVAVDLNNLAQLLKATNRLAEAEPLMRRALRIDEKSYGNEHPDVAIDLSNLASLLKATNRLAEAEPLMRRALRIDEKSYGNEHPDVAIDLSNLASLLQDTNRLAEAEPLMRRALQIFEKAYGPDHPNVATNLINLASLLQATNRLAEAEPLMLRALQIDEKSYGNEHPNVAIDLNNLARLLQATNRLAEAEPLMRRHLEIFLNFTRATGHPHPHLQAAVNNYAGLLSEMGLTEKQIRARLREMAPEFFA
jgi:tetratricopeptide (TPR) repeat protein